MSIEGHNNSKSLIKTLQHNPEAIALGITILTLAAIISLVVVGSLNHASTHLTATQSLGETSKVTTSIPLAAAKASTVDALKVVALAQIGVLGVIFLSGAFIVVGCCDRKSR